MIERIAWRLIFEFMNIGTCRTMRTSIAPYRCVVCGCWFPLGLRVRVAAQGCARLHRLCAIAHTRRHLVIHNTARGTQQT